MCFTLRLHTSAAPPRGGLTQALGFKFSPFETFEMTLPYIQIAVQCLVLVSFILTYLQIRAARRQARANVLLKMFEEWNQPELYDAIRYVHGLRREWKRVRPDTNEWQDLADLWVQNNLPNGTAQSDGAWIKRRRAAQFLDKIGYMLHAKYITKDDAFAIAPEVSRLVIVLIPLEKSIAKHFRDQEPKVAEWDQPSSKLYLGKLDLAAIDWFRSTGHKVASQ